MKNLIITLGLTVALPLGMAASTISWDFTGNGGNGSIGNSRTFNSGGVSVTATAWGVAANGGATFAPGALGQWSPGLGVCDSAEGAGCGSPQHQVDNSGRFDFVLFLFSNAVDPTSITIQPWGTYDRDVTYWTGYFSSTPSIGGKTLGELTGMGFSGPNHDLSTTSSYARPVSIGGGMVNAVLFGATTRAGYTGDDYFKIRGMCASVPDGQVPEPGTYALFGLGLLGFGLARRLRHS